MNNSFGEVCNLNKLVMYRPRYIGIVTIVNVIFVYVKVSMRIAAIKRTPFLEDVKICAVDMLEVGFNNERLMLILLNAIFIALFMRNVLRNNMLLQFRDRREQFCLVLKQCTFGAVILAVIAAATTLVWSLILTDVPVTNWLSSESYMQSVQGIPKNPEVLQLMEALVIFVLTMFLLLLVTGIIIIITSYIARPVIGIVGVMLLMTAELGSDHPMIKLLFYNVRLDNVRYYYGGMNYVALVGIPIAIIGILLIAGLLIANRKNYY